MRILVLVLSSDNGEPYRSFEEQIRRYSKSHKNIDYYFYKGHNGPTELKGDTLYLNCDDGWNGIYTKTMLAFRYFEPVLDNYDFVFRPNLSSFIVLSRYYTIMKVMPKTRMCAAFIGTVDNDLVYPSGAGFTLSTDVVKMLCKENVDNPLYHQAQDDINVGYFLKQYKIPIIAMQRATIEDGENVVELWKNNPSAYHFRIKTSDRMKDIESIKQLYSLAYEFKFSDRFI